MSLEPLVFHADGKKYKSPVVQWGQDSEDENVPEPVARPARGWFLYAGDGQQAVRVLDDLHSPAWGYQSRTLAQLPLSFWQKVKAFFAQWLARFVRGFRTLVLARSLSITNMTYPVWYLENGKVHEYKTICRLDQKKDWIYFLLWLLGTRNLEWIVQPKIGYADTDAANTNPWTDPVKWSGLDFGNNLRAVIDDPTLAPRYTRIETFDYARPPVFDGNENRWFLDGRPVSLEDTPQWMVVQTLVGHTPEKISYGPVSDKGDPGGAGKVVTPLIMQYPGVHATANLFFYRKPPFTAWVYAHSWMVDGLLTPQTGGKQVVIDAMCFTDFKVYGRAGNEWILLEEMLPRGDVLDKSRGGTWQDWRIYTDYGGHAPSCCMPPDIGWIRTVLK